MPSKTRKTRSTGRRTTRKRGAQNGQAAAQPESGAARQAQIDRDAKRRAQVVKRVNKGESVRAVAEDLGLTPGKAAFLLMQQEVEDNDSLQIKFRNEDELVKRVVAARNKNDEHSGWGWIAARTGVSEGKIKRLAEEKGGIKVKGTNIASIRKGKAPAKAQATKSTRKRGSGKKSGTVRRRRGGANPSKRG